MDKELLTKVFKNTTGAAIYIFLVSQIINNGDRIFGETNNLFAPFAFLLLFSLSAAIVGGLIFGPSVMLFFENKKQESIQAAIYSVSWLGFYTAIALITLLLIK